MVLSGGLFYVILKPLEGARKEFRRQLYLMVVVGLSALILSRGLSAKVESTAISDDNLHTLTPGMTVTVKGSRVTRLSEDYSVLVVGDQLVLVETGPNEQPALEYTGRALEIPSSPPKWEVISTPLRSLTRSEADFNLPLFDEAMIGRGAHGLADQLGYAILVLVGGIWLVKMVRQAPPPSAEPGSQSSAAIGALLILACVTGTILLEREVVAISAERDDFAQSAKPVSSGRVDPANQDQPVIISGELRSKQGVRDPELGVEFPTACSVLREVSMLQWDEVWEGEKLRGHTQIWSSEPVDCPSKPNPPFPIGSKFMVAPDCHIDAFTVPSDLVSELEPRTRKVVDIHPDAKTAKLGKWKTERGEHLLLTSHPRLGELRTRVRFLALDPGLVTVMGQQRDGTIVPHPGTYKGELYSIFPGRRGAASIKLSEEVQQLIGMAWIPLTLGLWLGCYLVLSSGLVGRKSDSAALLASGIGVFLWLVLLPTLVAAL